MEQAQEEREMFQIAFYHPVECVDSVDSFCNAQCNTYAPGAHRARRRLPSAILTTAATVAQPLTG